MLKMKLQCFDQLMLRTELFEIISNNYYPDAGKDWRQEEKGMTEGEIVGWHH